MIFVTVGTQLAFDRLVRAVDQWAARTGCREVFAQIGPDAYKPVHIPYKEFVEPSEFTALSMRARLLVAHAGMGSILTALQYGKPIVIMPRRAAMREQRNDHQLATVERLRGRPGIHVAQTESDLAITLDRLDTLTSGDRLPPYASESLIRFLRQRICETPGSGAQT